MVHVHVRLHTVGPRIFVTYPHLSSTAADFLVSNLRAMELKHVMPVSWIRGFIKKPRLPRI